MNSLKILIAVICLSGTIAAACGDGCLQCADSLCVRCDQTALYYLKDDKCQKSSGFHCVKIDESGNCTSCDQGFFLTSVGVCIYVYDRVPNCSDYAEQDNRIVCERCLEGFHPLRQMCVNNIPKCVEYKVGRNQCQRCFPGYKPSGDQFNCLEVVDSEA